MKRSDVIIFLLFILSGFFFYFYTGNISGNTVLDREVNITLAVDGDTLQTIDGNKIRLLGINTPEKGMYFYQEAKDFTKKIVENKTVLLKSSESDKYGRELGYVFVGNELLNEKIVENGFAHLYYYGTDKFYDQIVLAEKNAREKEVGIWKHSKNYGCVKLVELVYLDLTEKDKEKLSLKNDCDISLNLTIKDDATHIYKEKIPANGIFEKETQNIWNDNGDSVYIWDSDGLVFFYRYP
jgi:endonuclease YncB( thermonuclease family)